MQLWTAETYVVNNSPRMVPMSYLSSLSDKLDAIVGLVAQQRLESDIHMREAGTKKGLFVDPFRDDSMRDAGIVQTAAIVGGELTLPVLSAGAGFVSTDIASPACLPFAHTAILEQSARTGTMKVNPYQAFSPIPAKIMLTPAVDRWTDTQDTFGEPVTKRFVTGSGSNVSTTQTVQNVLASTQTTAIETLRQIPVSFQIDGFGPGEILHAVIFDGIPTQVSQ